MVLDSPAAYKKLGEHLCTVDPALEEWAAKKDFIRDFGRGRYPYRCYRRKEEVDAFVELGMEHDENEQKVDRNGIQFF